MKKLFAVSVIVTVAGVLGGCANMGPGGRDIDPRADQALRNMSTTLAGAKALSVKSDAITQEPADTGQQVQLHQRNKIIFCRPDRLYVESCPGDEVWGLWHKGDSLTIANMTAYAFRSVPAPVDQMADQLVADYDLVLPLVDLLFQDPYKEMTANVLTGSYLGEHKVNGVKCAHLLFTQEDIDWQIWIELGPKPVPRKLVIDYKLAPGRPQYTAVLSEWNLSPKVDDKVFDPCVPKGAKKMEMADLLGLRKGK